MTLEQFLFYLAATIAVVSTILALTRYNATHALIYLIISLLSSAIIFYLLGAPFAAVLEVVIYAGAIMVLFVFVVMMLNLGAPGIEQEMVWQKPRMWALPSLLTLILFFEIIYVLSTDTSNHSGKCHQSRAGWRKAVRTLCARGRNCLHAVVGRIGGSISPGSPVPGRKQGNPIVEAISIPLEQSLALAAVLFCIGLTGVIVRRNIIFILMSIEVMLNACGLAFIAVGARWNQADGQIMFMLILTIAAAEVAVGLGLLLQVHRRFRSIDIDQANSLKG